MAPFSCRLGFIAVYILTLFVKNILAVPNEHKRYNSGDARQGAASRNIDFEGGKDRLQTFNPVFAPIYTYTWRNFAGRGVEPRVVSETGQQLNYMTNTRYLLFLTPVSVTEPISFASNTPQQPRVPWSSERKSTPLYKLVYKTDSQGHTPYVDRRIYNYEYLKPIHFLETYSAATLNSNVERFAEGNSSNFDQKNRKPTEKKRRGTPQSLSSLNMRFAEIKEQMYLHRVPDGVASSDALTHGGLMSQIKRNLKHSVAGAFEPPFDPVRNLPAMFSKEAIGGRTVFTNPMSNPHVFGLPFTPNGDHNTWPGLVKGFETRIPSIVVPDPMRSSDYGSASNPPMELGNMRPMVFAQTDGSQ